MQAEHDPSDEIDVREKKKFPAPHGREDDHPGSKPLPLGPAS